MARISEVLERRRLRKARERTRQAKIAGSSGFPRYGPSERSERKTLARPRGKSFLAARFPGLRQPAVWARGRGLPVARYDPER